MLRVMPSLYPAQAEGVARFLAQPRPRRFILPWKTGCGKTAATLTALRRLSAPAPPRTLIVCPAVVRNHWWREICKWIGAEAQQQAAEIAWGRNRHLSKAKEAKRAQAYCCQIQIVSYDLLKEVEAEGWELIVLDELHHIAAPLSKQSRMARLLVAANPRADILGLSATLIPTEVKQLWNPLRIMFGEAEWGPRSSTGDISWDFIFQYCNTERTEYGIRSWGVRDDRAAQLRGRLSAITYPLSREDIIDDLPPLDVKLLQMPSQGDSLKTMLLDWHDQFDGDDVKKIVVLVRHRKLAHEVKVALDKAKVFYIDGSVPPDRRAEVLDACAAADRCTLVGTHEALSEGVRLMWAQQAIIAEWSQSPGRVIQLLGRFNSVGSTERPQVSILCTDDTYGAANNLIARTEAVMASLGSSPAESTIAKTFAAAAELEAPDEAAWLNLFTSQKSEEWHDDDPQA
jgi:hypothetical protein